MPKAIFIAAMLGFFIAQAHAAATPGIAPELVRSVAKIRLCIEKTHNCRFSVVGIVSPDPVCQFSVMPSAWNNFSETDKVAVEQLAKLFLAQMELNPVEVASSVESGAGIPKTAPIFQVAVRQLAKVSRCQIALSTGKDKHGLPGWDGKILDKPAFTR